MNRDTEMACENTDKEIWREREDDYYADSIHATPDGRIGMSCGGMVITKPIREWHKAALQSQSFDVEALKKEATKHLSDRLDGHAKVEAKTICNTIDHLASQGVLNTGWQTMDILPDENDIVIVSWPDGFWQQAKFIEGDFWFETKGRGNHLVNKTGFTHWHKPTPPKQEGE